MATTKHKSQKCTRAFTPGDRVILTREGRKAVRTWLTFACKMAFPDADAQVACMTGPGTITGVEGERVTIRFDTGALAVTGRAFAAHLH